MKNTTGIGRGGSRLRERPVPSSSHATDTQALGCNILNAGKINYLLPDDLCAVSSDSALHIGGNFFKWMNCIFFNYLFIASAVVLALSMSKGSK